MSEGVPPGTLSWAASALGSGTRILRIESMPEASHTNHHLVAETPAGSRVDAVLRRFTDRERLRTDPWYLPGQEAASLATLAHVDLPVPRLLAADLGAVACDVPTLVLSWLPGEPPERPRDLDRFVDGLARPLSTIHGARTTAGLRRYEPYFESDGTPVNELRPPPWSSDPALWERVFEALEAVAPGGPIRFIHRDYHHGNTLWQEDELVGIVDWTTGCLGPPGIDLAQMRVNLAWDFGLELADAFLIAADRWGVTGHHPYWDLLDAADWLSDEPPADAGEAARYERYQEFVRRALAELR
jgi:aminoglycoside phosphotransferase (APT) family kinase protein